MTIFRVPRLPTETPASLASVLSNAFKQLYADLKAITTRPGTVAIQTGSYSPVVGETVRVQPPTGGMAFVLPTPNADNRGQDITAILENPQGNLRVTVSAGRDPQGVIPTVDGSTLATFATAGTVRFVSNGIDKWSVARGPAGADGAAGATGATGAKGDKGDQGDTGATGATGVGGGYPFPRLDASLSPVALYDFDSRVTDLNGNGLTPSSGTPLYQLLWGNMVGLSCHASALARSSYDSALAILGDCSIESIVYFMPGIGASSVYLCYMGVSVAGSSDNNFNYAINVSYTPTGPSYSFQWFSQHGTKISDTFTVSTGLAPPNGFPFHLIGTRTNDVIKFYLNGVLIGTSSALTTPTVTGTASRFNIATLGSLCGQLGLAVYDYALSAAQVKARYNASLGQIFGTI